MERPRTDIAIAAVASCAAGLATQVLLTVSFVPLFLAYGGHGSPGTEILPFLVPPVSVFAQPPAIVSLIYLPFLFVLSWSPVALLRHPGRLLVLASVGFWIYASLVPAPAGDLPQTAALWKNAPELLMAPAAVFIGSHLLMLFGPAMFHGIFRRKMSTRA